MPLSEGNFQDLLRPWLKGIWDEVTSRPRPMVETLFAIESSTRFQESYLGMGSMGIVPRFDGTISYDQFDAGYRTDIMNFEFARGIAVERTLVDDDQYGQIRRRCENMSDAFNITVEQDAVNVFVNAFTDSGTNRMGASTNGADGVALCSTAHPYSPRNSNTTQSNEGTLALTIDNLDTTRQAMRNFTDDSGNLLGVNPNILLVPPELERSATHLINERAIYEPNSAEYNVNMFNGRFQLIVWDRLTDANSWFLMDSTLMKRHNIFQWRVSPEFAEDSDFNSLTARFRGYMRYGVGFTDWRWVYGNNPS